MDLRAMLNNDAPSPTPPPVSSRAPVHPSPLQHHQLPPSPYRSPGPQRYDHHQQQQQQPRQHYQTQGYPYPPPSPVHTAQGYGPPRISAQQQAHPSLSSHSSPSAGNGQFPAHSRYAPPPPQPPQQQHVRAPSQQQQQQHPPPSPLGHYHHGYSGYPPRQSPLASPIGSRATVTTPIARERSVHNQRERDVSISPKTRVPYPHEEDGYGGGRALTPVKMEYATAPGSSRRASSATTLGMQERRSVDMMDVDSERKWSSPVSERLKVNGSESSSSSGGSEIGPSTSQGPNTTPAPPARQHLSLQPQRPRPPPPPPPPPPLRQTGNNNSTTNTTNNNNNNSSNKNNATSVPPSPAANSPAINQEVSLHQQPRPSPAIVGPPPSTQQSSSPPNTSTPTPTPTPAQQQPPPPPDTKPVLGPPPTPSVKMEDNNSSAPPRKRARRDGAPVWAQKARPSSSSPLMPHRTNSNAGQPPPAPAPSNPPPPQHQPSHPPPAPSTSAPPRSIPGLGPWEPSINNVEPHEELSRCIADFLFMHVVQQTDPAFASSSPTAPILEIEAKIGNLIDKNTNSRLRLPIRTETIFDADDPSWRIQFRSSMNDRQHRLINDFLNHCFKAANAGQERLPMTYVHTKEKDTFFELPADRYKSLPPSILETLNPRHKLRVRVTTDLKTGQITKKIVKARIADLNVYSPKTAFDWRVSVNMEMPYEGEMEGLYPLGGGVGSGEGDRNKDRVSYKSLVYQVDLTQVTDKSGTKEHELEVEVDGLAIKKQGMLAKQNEPNGYEAVVKGFVDNVRVLVRAAGAAAPAGV